MYVQNSVRFGVVAERTNGYEDFATSESASNFAALLPSGGHLIHLGEDRSPHTVAMFHQLECLGILRNAYADMSARLKV